tara:strand:- start:134 stop:409 length:276 start_codon:yes stop_codon:yes gene_type:complete
MSEEIVEDREPTPEDYAPTLDEIIRKAMVEGKSIFCENEAVSDFIKLTIPDLICSYDATDFRIYDFLLFSYGYINRKAMKDDAEEYWVELN